MNWIAWYFIIAIAWMLALRSLDWFLHRHELSVNEAEFSPLEITVFGATWPLSMTLFAYGYIKGMLQGPGGDPE